MRMPQRYAGKHNDNIFTKYFYKNDDKRIKITLFINDDVDYSSMGGFDMGVDVDNFGMGDLNMCGSGKGGYSLGVNVSDPSLSDYDVCGNVSDYGVVVIMSDDVDGNVGGDIRVDVEVDVGTDVSDDGGGDNVMVIISVDVEVGCGWWKVYQ